MKTGTKKQRDLFRISILTGLLGCNFFAPAQVCDDNLNTAYGLTTSGVIRPINLTTGTVGTRLDSLTTPYVAENANGMGYNANNGKFYYFHRSAALSAPAAEFVCYDPLAHTLQVLPGSPPTNKIRSGCVNQSGTGYYCLDPTAAAGPTLYYYNFIAGTWTAITTVYMDGATNVSLNFKNIVSGDMAFDLAGNLWILIANSANYGMYQIPDPVPTTPQASVSVNQIVPVGPSPGGASITGIAFNQQGYAFLTTASGINPGNNLLYRMTSTTSGLTYVANLNLNGAGDDLTSCVFTYVLPVKWLSFTANLMKQKGIELEWEVAEDDYIKEYHVEHSLDGVHWERIAVIHKNSTAAQYRSRYSYTHSAYHTGKNYYRIVEEDVFGKTQGSEIKQIISNDLAFILYPNPVNNILIIRQTGIQATEADIFDSYGNLVLSKRILCSNQAVDISRLVKGNYLLKLRAGKMEVAHSNFIKL